MLLRFVPVCECDFRSHCSHSVNTNKSNMHCIHSLLLKSFIGIYGKISIKQLIFQILLNRASSGALHLVYALFLRASSSELFVRAIYSFS